LIHYFATSASIFSLFFISPFLHPSYSLRHFSFHYFHIFISSIDFRHYFLFIFASFSLHIDISFHYFFIISLLFSMPLSPIAYYFLFIYFDYFIQRHFFSFSFRIAADFFMAYYFAELLRFFISSISSLIYDYFAIISLSIFILFFHYYFTLFSLHIIDIALPARCHFFYAPPYFRHFFYWLSRHCHYFHYFHMPHDCCFLFIIFRFSILHYFHISFHYAVDVIFAMPFIYDIFFIIDIAIWLFFHYYFHDIAIHCCHIAIIFITIFDCHFWYVFHWLLTPWLSFLFSCPCCWPFISLLRFDISAGFLSPIIFDLLFDSLPLLTLSIFFIADFAAISCYPLIFHCFDNTLASIRHWYFSFFDTFTPIFLSFIFGFHFHWCRYAIDYFIIFFHIFILFISIFIYYSFISSTFPYAIFAIYLLFSLSWGHSFIEFISFHFRLAAAFFSH